MTTTSTKYFLVATLAFAAQAVQPAAAQACNGPSPPIVNANTVHIQFMADSQCCTNSQGFVIGNVGACHATSTTFNSWRQSVGQNMFGRNIKIATFQSRDCSGRSDLNSLTNARNCFAFSGNSFQLVQT